MRFLGLILFGSSLFAGAASSSLQFVPLSNLNEQRVVPLSNGAVLIVGSENVQNVSCVSAVAGSCITQLPNISILSSSGIQTGAFDTAPGTGNGEILDAAVDAAGNIWIIGVTDSDDFPLVNPLFAQKLPYRSTGFVAKLDSNLNILFSTFLGGQETQTEGTSAVSTPTSITIDGSGNVYVAGHTGEAGFPTTGPVLGTGASGPTTTSLSPLVYGFIAKIASDGSRLLYSDLLGGNQVSCQGSACVAAAATTTPYALAVDANGNITVAGSTNALNFPVTAGVLYTACECANPTYAGFISRISEDGSALVWSTFIDTNPPVAPFIDTNPPVAPFPNTTIQSIALDASDDVYFAGFTTGGFPSSSGAVQPSVPQTGTNGFAAKLSSDGTKLLYGTNLGGQNGANLTGLALDASGDVWIAGHTKSPDFPGATAVPASGIDFALELNANASAVEQFLPLVSGTVSQPPAFDSTGNLLLLSSQGNLFRLNTTTATSAPAVWAVTNAAVLTAQPGLAPGEIATLFGVGLGPSPGIVGEPDANGFYPTELGGVSVQFTINGLSSIPAPLLYVGPGQINFQVPFRFLGQGAMTVTTPSVTLPAMQVPQISSIGIFQQNGYAAALNQDGSVNSSSNPAAAGSIVSLFVTGIDQTSDLQPNGAISQSASPDSLAPSLGIEVLSGTFPGPLPVLYAGAAPDLINGLFQINVELPQGVTNPSLTVQQLLTGSAGTSNTVQINAH